MTTVPYTPALDRPEDYLNISYRVRSWLLTVDHKRIAVLYFISVTLFFLIGGGAAVLMRLELMTPAGALPVLLWGVAVVGMLWADVAWSERLQGLRGFHKLLVIPLLLAQ